MWEAETCKNWTLPHMYIATWQICDLQDEYYHIIRDKKRVRNTAASLKTLHNILHIYTTNIKNLICISANRWKCQYELDELDFTQNPHDRKVIRVYFIIYSQANSVEFSTCRDFVEKVLEFFLKQRDDKNPPLQWPYCQELDADCRKHYHMVKRFKKSRRWMPIQKYIIQNFGIKSTLFILKPWLCCSI